MVMDDETKARIGKLRHEVSVGLEISALLNNTIVKSTLDGLLHGVQNEWLGETNREARELLWQRALGLQEFIGVLKSLIDTGKMAHSQLELERRMNGEQNDQES
jgi:hypothetical protein